mmetsp:Transcript_7763/g.20407  ORF Transcript_7763/g.20407 Transcript_7763/m.20407 type:complete len:200 (+) Transcript_7763:110-709(+)|eukprot:669871-Prymnesium_polylepis.2
MGSTLRRRPRGGVPASLKRLQMWWATAIGPSSRGIYRHGLCVGCSRRRCWTITTFGVASTSRLPSTRRRYAPSCGLAMVGSLVAHAARSARRAPAACPLCSCSDTLEQLLLGAGQREGGAVAVSSLALLGLIQPEKEEGRLGCLHCRLGSPQRHLARPRPADAAANHLVLNARAGPRCLPHRIQGRVDGRGQPRHAKVV